MSDTVCSVVSKREFEDIFRGKTNKWFWFTLFLSEFGETAFQHIQVKPRAGSIMCPDRCINAGSIYLKIISNHNWKGSGVRTSTLKGFRWLFWSNEFFEFAGNLSQLSIRHRQRHIEITSRWETNDKMRWSVNQSVITNKYASYCWAATTQSMTVSPWHSVQYTAISPHRQSSYSTAPYRNWREISLTEYWRTNVQCWSYWQWKWEWGTSWQSIADNIDNKRVYPQWGSYGPVSAHSVSSDTRFQSWTLYLWCHRLMIKFPIAMIHKA